METRSPRAFPRRDFRRNALELACRKQILGRLLGVSAQSIHNWESEKARPRAEQIAKLRELDRRYGDALWWTSLAEVAGRCRATQS